MRHFLRHFLDKMRHFFHVFEYVFRYVFLNVFLRVIFSIRFSIRFERKGQAAFTHARLNPCRPMRSRAWRTRPLKGLSRPVHVSVGLCLERAPVCVYGGCIKVNCTVLGRVGGGWGLFSARSKNQGYGVWIGVKSEV